MAEPVTIEEGPLNEGTRRAAAALCGRAFLDDPFFKFLLPSDARREASLARLHDAVLAHAGPTARHAVARSSDGAVVGVSLWLPPGAFPPKAGTQLAQLPGTFAAFWRFPGSMVNGNRIMRAAFRAHPREPHWYLQLLAVEPSAQRSGVGAALMAPTIARIDDEHLPAYLETQNEENVAYYARYRFSLAHRLEPVEGAPPLLALRRDAA